MQEEHFAVILTSADSQVAPELVEQIRGYKDIGVRIIGVDAQPRGNGIGAQFCDVFYRVPLGSHPDFVETIREIVNSEGVFLIFIGSDEEVLALSGYKKTFEALGCKVACGDHESIKLCLDKVNLMHYLRSQGISVGEFYALEGYDDLEKAARRLGYPERTMVFKPRIGRGGRGVRIVTEEFSHYQQFLKREATHATLADLKDLFSREADMLPNFFLMEYFPNEKCSVDLLVFNGEVASAVTRHKIYPIGSPTQIAELIHRPAITEYALQIASLIQFDYFVQFEIGLNAEDKPRLIEINPRLDATVPITMGVNRNYFSAMIDYCRGVPVHFDPIAPSPSSRTMFYRYWSHRFSYETTVEEEQK